MTIATVSKSFAPGTSGSADYLCQSADPSQPPSTAAGCRRSQLDTEASAGTKLNPQQIAASSRTVGKCLAALPDIVTRAGWTLVNDEQSLTKTFPEEDSNGRRRIMADLQTDPEMWTKAGEEMIHTFCQSTLPTNLEAFFGRNPIKTIIDSVTVGPKLGWTENDKGERKYYISAGFEIKSGDKSLIGDSPTVSLSTGPLTDGRSKTTDGRSRYPSISQLNSDNLEAQQELWRKEMDHRRNLLPAEEITAQIQEIFRESDRLTKRLKPLANDLSFWQTPALSQTISIDSASCSNGGGQVKPAGGH